MTTREYKYGDLNNVEQSQNPLSLDSDATAIDVISKNNKDAMSPRVLSKMIGNYRAERFDGAADQTVLKSDSSWFTKLFKGDFRKYRARIPEIHAHLPKPDNYTNCSQTIACLYPEFVSESETKEEAAPGTIVWCSFLDKENFLEPVYRGKVSNMAAVSVGELATRNDKKTQLAGSPGQTPTAYTPTGKYGTPDIEDLKCGGPNDKRSLDFPGCSKYKPSPGENKEYDLYENGQVVGKAIMVSWINPNGSSKLISQAMEKPLLAMKTNMKSEIGQDLIINSGFRSYEQQACMYEIYLKCMKKWQQNGSPPQSKPSVVGNPNGSGKNSHMNGKAVDFATGGVQPNDLVGIKDKKQVIELLKDKKTWKNSWNETWKWLVENSEKYGFFWTGLSIDEPWHFEFHEDKVQIS